MIYCYNLVEVHHMGSMQSFFEHTNSMLLHSIVVELIHSNPKSQPHGAIQGKAGTNKVIQSVIHPHQSGGPTGRPL